MNLPGPHRPIWGEPWGLTRSIPLAALQVILRSKAICLGLGAADIVASRALCGECFQRDASLPDLLEGGGGPLANTSSQKPESLEHGQLKTQERQEHKSAMRHGNWWPGSSIYDSERLILIREYNLMPVLYIRYCTVHDSGALHNRLAG